MLIADLIVELQERPAKALTVFVFGEGSSPAARRRSGHSVRGAAYEYGTGFIVFRADAPSIDLEMNDELTIYARIAYPMPVKGTQTLRYTSALRDTGGCYCGTCINARLEYTLGAVGVRYGD